MQFWSFLLCIYGVVIVSEAETCQETAPELYKATARFAWTGFALAIACIITSLSTAIFVMLMRTGAITTSDAAASPSSRCVTRNVVAHDGRTGSCVEGITCPTGSRSPVYAGGAGAFRCFGMATERWSAVAV